MQDGIFTGHFLTGIWMRTLFYKGHVVFFCKYSFRGLHSQMVLARENKSDNGVTVQRCYSLKHSESMYEVISKFY